MLDLAFLVDVTSQLNYLNMKLQDNDKLFPSLANYVSAFKMKLKLLISQLEKKDLSQLPNLKEQRECIENISTLQNTLKKSNYFKRPLIVVLVIFLKDRTLAFINPFSLNEHNILKIPSNMQMGAY